MTVPASKTPTLKALIDSRSLPIELFGSGSSRHQRKLVYNYLASFANPDGTHAYPGMTKIARECGLSRRGLIRILHWLEDHYLLAKGDERSAKNTNSYTILYSEEAQKKCRQAIAEDDKERTATGKKLKTHEARVLGGKRAAERRRASQSPAPPAQGSDSQQSPLASDCSSHRGSDCGAEVVTVELSASDSLESHDRPLPSLKPSITVLPTVPEGRKEGEDAASGMPNQTDKVIRLLSDCLKTKGAPRTFPNDAQTDAIRADIGTFGKANVILAFVMFTGRPKGVQNLLDPWKMFTDESSAYMYDVREARKEIGSEYESEAKMVEELYSNAFYMDATRDLFERVCNEVGVNPVASLETIPRQTAARALWS